MAVAASAATRIGVSTVAAHQVVLQIWLLWALLIDSVAVAAQIMVPRVLAAGDEEQVKELLRLLWGWGVLGGCLLGLLTVPLIYILPQWFSTEPEVISNIRSAMLILVVLQPIGGIVFVGDGIFLGAKRFGFLAASCATGGLLAFPVLLFACDTLLAVWVVILGFVSFRALAMGAYFYRTGGKLVYTAPDGVG
jgi:MATE family multidrug resistance protein